MEEFGDNQNIKEKKTSVFDLICSIPFGYPGQSKYTYMLPHDAIHLMDSAHHSSGLLVVRSMAKIPSNYLLTSQDLFISTLLIHYGYYLVTQSMYFSV